jgi:hypothetical protein
MAQLNPKTENPSMDPPDIYRYPKDARYQDSNRKWQGMTNIGRAPKGRLWAGWYTGNDKEGIGNWSILYTSENNGKNWDGPALTIVHSNCQIRSTDPIFLTDPDNGRMWVFFSQSSEFWDGVGGIWVIYTDNPDDPNPEWSKPRRVFDGRAVNPPTILKNGSWLMTSYGEGSSFFGECAIHVYESCDRGLAWKMKGKIRPVTEMAAFNEGMIVEQNDSSLRALIRSRSNMGILSAYSNDNGSTWTPAEDAKLSPVVSKFQFFRLPSGKQLLVYNNPPNGSTTRDYLTAALSEDDGKTWPHKIIIDERPHVAYPGAAFDSDGTIFTSYEHNRYYANGTPEILLAIFTEADIKAGHIVTPDSSLKNIINSLVPMK